MRGRREALRTSESYVVSVDFDLVVIRNTNLLMKLIATLTEKFFAIYKRVRKLKSPIEKLDTHSE